MTDTEGSVGDLQLGTVVVNVQDMPRAVGFWTAALGYVRRERDWDPEFMMLADPAGRQLRPADGDRTEEHVAADLDDRRAGTGGTAQV